MWPCAGLITYGAADLLNFDAEVIVVPVPTIMRMMKVLPLSFSASLKPLLLHLFVSVLIGL